VGGTAFPGNQSLRGLLARCLHTASVPAAVWVPVTVAVALLGLALAVVARRHLPGGPGDLAGASTAALTGLLVSPISWTHHWVWIVPGAVALAGLAARAPARRMWAPALVVAVMLAVPGRRAELTTSIPTGLVWRVPYRYGRELRLGGAELLVANTYVLLGLAALVAGAVVAVRRAARTTESPPAPAPRVRTDGAESLPIS
jgi:alpha-1,2-mannosyltransferase